MYPCSLLSLSLGSAAPALAGGEGYCTVYLTHCYIKYLPYLMTAQPKPSCGWAWRKNSLVPNHVLFFHKKGGRRVLDIKLEHIFEQLIIVCGIKFSKTCQYFHICIWDLLKILKLKRDSPILWLLLKNVTASFFLLKNPNPKVQKQSKPRKMRLLYCCIYHIKALTDHFRIPNKKYVLWSMWR